MADASDMDLVREYAARNSEPAFAELVRRHVNLVYSVALRFTGQPQDAQDVAQAVFCHRSLQNQPLRVDAKPATLSGLIHIRFLEICKRTFHFFVTLASRSTHRSW